MRKPQKSWNFWKIGPKWPYFSRKILKNGYPFWPKSPLKMGMGFEAWVAHPCPTQIWVPPPPGIGRFTFPKASSAVANQTWETRYYFGKNGLCCLSTFSFSLALLDGILWGMCTEVLRFGLDRGLLLETPPHFKESFWQKRVPIFEDFSWNIDPFFSISGCSHGNYPKNFGNFGKNRPMFRDAFVENGTHV